MGLRGIVTRFTTVPLMLRLNLSSNEEVTFTEKPQLKIINFQTEKKEYHACVLKYYF